jgi:hypothetical protein
MSRTFPRERRRSAHHGPGVGSLGMSTTRSTAFATAQT